VIAVTCGIVTTLAVGRLTLSAIHSVASRRLLSHGAYRLPRAWAVLRRGVRRVQRDPARWGIAVGILMWLWLITPLAAGALSMERIYNPGNDVPALNYPGPKVWATPLRDGVRSLGNPYVIANLLAVWLMTVRWREGRHQPQRRLLARWGAVLLIGMTNGFIIASPWLADQSMTSERTAILLALAEVPATLLLYLHLSSVARDAATERLSRMLIWLGVASTALIVVPLTLLGLSPPLHLWRVSATLHLG
jgi:hypothetical protein